MGTYDGDVVVEVDDSCYIAVETVHAWGKGGEGEARGGRRKSW